MGGRRRMTRIKNISASSFAGEHTPPSLRAATLPDGTREDPGGHISGWQLTRFRSVSKKETYFPTPGISIGSPRTSPPASPTFLIEDLMSATPMTRAGTCAGQDTGVEYRALDRRK